MFTQTHSQRDFQIVECPEGCHSPHLKSIDLSDPFQSTEPEKTPKSSVRTKAGKEGMGTMLGQGGMELTRDASESVNTRHLDLCLKPDKVVNTYNPST